MLELIPGYPGYLASEDGRIWSDKSGVRLQKKARMHRGSWHVNLKQDGKLSKIAVHTLVLLAFHGPKPAVDSRCRHLDGDPLNNNAVNLCWGSPKEAMSDQIRHGTAACIRRGERSNASVLTDEQVVVIRGLRGLTKQADIAALTGIAQRHVSRIQLRQQRIDP